MRKSLIASGGVLVVAMGLTAAIPPLIGGESWRAPLQHRLQEILGPSARLEGALSWRLLPRPSLQAQGLSIGGADGIPALEAESLTVDLDLLPLLIGRIDGDSAEITHPRLAGRLLADSIRLHREDAQTLGATARIAQDRWDLKAQLSSLSGSREQMLQVRLATQGGLTATIDGTVNRSATVPTFQGRMHGEAADLSRMLSPLGQTAPGGAVALDGTVAIAGGLAEVRDFSARLGAGSVEGGFSVALDGKTLDARLTVSGVNIDSWKAPASPQTSAPSQSAPPDGQRQPQTATFSAFLPRDLFANLDIGVQTLTWGGRTISSGRLETTILDGDMIVRRAEIGLPGTSLSIEGTLSTADKLPVFEGQAALTSSHADSLGNWLGIPLPFSTIEMKSPLRWKARQANLDDIRALVDNTPVKGHVAILTAGDWRVETQFEATGLLMTANGRVSEPVDLAIGVSHAQAPKILRVWGWHGGIPAGSLNLEAHLTNDPSGVTLSPLTISVGPTRLTGQARMTHDGRRPIITTSIEAGDVDLGPWLDAAPLPTQGPPAKHKTTNTPKGQSEPKEQSDDPASSRAQRWSTRPLDLTFLFPFDAQVNFRAKSVIWPTIRLDDVSSQITLTDGNLTLDTLQARLWDGTLTGQGRLTAGAVASLAGEIALHKAKASAIGLSGAGLKLESGVLETRAKLSSHGRSPADLIAHLDGSGNLFVTDGSISGFDLPAVSHRLEHMETLGNLLGAVQAGLSGGTTPFSRLGGNFTVNNGIVVSHDLVLSAQGGGATIDTLTDLPRWNTETMIAIRLGDAAPPVNLRIQGPIDAPRKTLDANAIQRHLMAQGLGQALKDSLKDSRTKTGDESGKSSGKSLLRGLMRNLGGGN